MISTIYSGIKRVGYANDPMLLFERLVPLYHGASIDPQATFHEVCLSVPGDMKTETKQENGETIYTTTLVFKTREDVPTNRALCWRVIDKVGNGYLVGTGEQPHPVVTVVDDNSSDPKTPRVKHVTVTWTSKIGYLTCSS